MTEPTQAQCEAVADAWRDERDLWFLRRKFDKSGYQMVRWRELNCAICEENMIITDIDMDREGAQFHFEWRRDLAAAEAAIKAYLKCA